MSIVIHYMRISIGFSLHYNRQCAMRSNDMQFALTMYSCAVNPAVTIGGNCAWSVKDATIVKEASLCNSKNKIREKDRDCAVGRENR